jgi:hypothetical protein
VWVRLEAQVSCSRDALVRFPVPTGNGGNSVLDRCCQFGESTLCVNFEVILLVRTAGTQVPTVRADCDSQVFDGSKLTLQRSLLQYLSPKMIKAMPACITDDIITSLTLLEDIIYSVLVYSQLPLLLYSTASCQINGVFHKIRMVFQGYSGRLQSKAVNIVLPYTEFTPHLAKKRCFDIFKEHPKSLPNLHLAIDQFKSIRRLHKRRRLLINVSSID